MTIDKPQLRTWLVQVETEVSDLNRRIVELEKKRDAEARRISLIRELLGEESSAVVVVAESTPFRQALVEILSADRAPLHLDDLRRELGLKGIAIPGRGTDANIIAHLRRIPGVARVMRGTYALTNGAQNLTPATPQRRRKRRAKRRRVSSGDTAVSGQRGK
jgi:hypothetical protein